jgi:hypothetical protein
MSLNRSAYLEKEAGMKPPTAARPVKVTPVKTSFSPSGIFSGTALHFSVGIMFLLIGTLLAVLTVPNDVMPAGVLRLSSLFMALGLASGLILKLWFKPIAIFDPINVIITAPVYWMLLDPIQGAYDLWGVHSNDVKAAYGCIMLFALGVYIATITAPWGLPRVVWNAAKVNLSSQTIFSLATVCFIIAFLRFAIPSNFNFLTMWNALFMGRWSAPWARGALGGMDAFLDHLQYFGYILPIMAVMIGRMKGWLRMETLCTIAYVLIIGALLSAGGGRRIIGVLAGSAFVVWFLTAKKPGFKHLLGFALMAAVLLWFLQMMLYFRGVGIGRAFTEEKSDLMLDKRLEYLHVDDNFLRTCQLVRIFPDEVPHVEFKWLIWVLIRPIPRVFWPGKPTSPGFDLAEYLGFEGVGFSYSIIGELYMAFGFLGCLVGGWVIGRIALCLRMILQPDRSFGAMILFGIGLLALFTGIRSGIELILMSYGGLAWIFIIWIYQKIIHTTTPQSAPR